MSTTPDTPATGQRLEVIAGLRALADFLEETPAAPTPTWLGATCYHYGERRELDLDQFVEEARAIGGQVCIEDDAVVALRAFGPVTYKAKAPANAILEKRPVEREEFVLPPELAELTGVPA